MQLSMKLLLTSVTLGWLAVIQGTLAESALENDSILHERWEHMYSVPGKFILNNEDDIEVVDFDSSREVRICLDNSDYTVPLEVNYRYETEYISSGECALIEADEFSVSAARELPEGWSLEGRFDDLGSS
jgi:hypothetical protein